MSVASRRTAHIRPGRAPLALALSLLLGAPAARAASLSVESGVVVLGRTESANVHIRVDEPPGSEDLPLRISVNVGSFSQPKRFGPGKYRAVYVPPTTRYPQMALIAVWRETGPDAPIEFLRVPLFGTTKLSVTARPGASVRVQVGLDTFGPAIADAHGHAVVGITVPPDVLEATVHIEERGGAVTTKKVAIEVPPYNRLTAALVPHAIVTDGHSAARLDVQYDLGGAQVSPDRVHVEATLGRVGFERAARGAYVYRYVPPAGAHARDVSFKVTVDGDPVAQASVKLSLGLPAAGRIVVRPPTKPMTAGSGASAPVGVLVLDAEGLGLPGQRVELTANGEPLAAVYRGGGLYEATFAAPAIYPPGGLVRFEARVAGGNGPAVTGVANLQLLATSVPHLLSARLAPSPVPTDGRTEAQLELDVRDAAGMPLRAAQLLVAASDGTIGALRAAGKGKYVASYVPPDALPPRAAALRVVDASGSFERTLPLPLRTPPGRLLLGVRGGYVNSLGDLAGPRLGADLTVPVRVGGASFALSATAGYGAGSQQLRDPSTGVEGRATATFFPLALRASAELWAGRRASLSIGAGAIAAIALFRDSLSAGETSATGFGGLGFAALTFALGPGRFVGELSFSHASVESSRATLPAGGFGLELGYQVRVL